MTKEEIRKFLDNTKVYINGKTGFSYFEDKCTYYGTNDKEYHNLFNYSLGQTRI